MTRRKRPYERLRWSRFKQLAATEMFGWWASACSAFLRTLGGDGSAFASHMKGARFTIPLPPSWPCSGRSPGFAVRWRSRHKADSYGTLLGKLATACTNASSAHRATSSS